jgi:predicted enzyme related to lactoylglutathione lyase
MPSFILNIDVPDIDTAVAFYTAAFELRLGRRFDSRFVELLGAETSLYLLEKEPGSLIGPAGGDIRRYERHWSPIHADFVVEDIAAATAKVVAAGAVQEGETQQAPYGQLAMFADPFGQASA